MDILNLDRKADLSPGEWIDDIPDHPDLRLKVRSTNYKPFRVATAALGRRSRKQLKTDEGFVDYAVRLGKPLAEHILLDWDGVKSGDKPVKYSPEIALKLLTADDDFGIGSNFRAAVEWAGDQVAEQLAAATEEAAGN